MSSRRSVVWSMVSPACGRRARRRQSDAEPVPHGGELVAGMLEFLLDAFHALGALLPALPLHSAEALAHDKIELAPQLGVGELAEILLVGFRRGRLLRSCGAAGSTALTLAFPACRWRKSILLRSSVCSPGCAPGGTRGSRFGRSSSCSSRVCLPTCRPRRQGAAVCARARTTILDGRPTGSENPGAGTPGTAVDTATTGGKPQWSPGLLIHARTMTALMPAR